MTAISCYNTGMLSAYASGEGAKIHTAGFLGWGNYGGDLALTWVHDYSYRINDDVGINAGVVGNCANTELVKILEECYALNEEESEAYFTAVYGGTRNATTLSDLTCALVNSEGEEVTFHTEATTFAKELARIDAVLASVDKVTGEFNDPYAGLENTPSKPSTPSTPSTPDPSDDEDEDEDSKAEATVGGADEPDETTEAAEEGCGSAVGATFAVLALTAACGMAIVGKKKED